MRKLVYISFLSLFLVGIGSCKKNELPTPIEEKPVVWVEGKINGIPFKYEAGINSSYSYTIANDIDSQSRQFIFRINAPEFKKSLEISINNAAYTLGSVQQDLNNTITPGSYKFTYSNSFPSLPYRTSEIILLYIDHTTNAKYYTIPYNQSAINAEFNILSVADKVYEGKHYKMAEISFHCRVKNPYTGFWYDITNGYGFIPFGEQ